VATILTDITNSAANSIPTLATVITEIPAQSHQLRIDEEELEIIDEDMIDEKEEIIVANSTINHLSTSATTQLVSASSASIVPIQSSVLLRADFPSISLSSTQSSSAVINETDIHSNSRLSRKHKKMKTAKIPSDSEEDKENQPPESQNFIAVPTTNRTSAPKKTRSGRSVKKKLFE